MKKALAMEIRIEKDLGDFRLDLAFSSDCRRIGILGASGCGKSLTLRCIAGIETPDRGRIQIGEKLMFDSQQRISQKTQVRRVGYLFQNYALFPTMTVEQNIGAGLTGKRPAIRSQISRMVERFQLEGLEKRLPGQLSGGQQQRVALARILACEPEVILLDEPFSALDVYLRDQMQRELMELLKDYPGIVILVSHNRDEVYRMSEELLILEKGRLAGQGPTRELFREPKNTAAARLTGCKNIAACLRQGDGTFLIPEWEFTFSLLELGSRGADFFKGQTGREIHAAAIRAHQFRVRRTEEPCFSFPVLEPVVTEDLFEFHISFRPGEAAPGRMDWKVSKEIWDLERDGLPTRLFLKKEDLLLLDG